MIWTANSAKRHTKKAATPAKKRKWAKTANAVLKSSGNEGRAVRIANAAVKRKPKPKRRA